MRDQGLEESPKGLSSNLDERKRKQNNKVVKLVYQKEIENPEWEKKRKKLNDKKGKLSHVTQERLKQLTTLEREKILLNSFYNFEKKMWERYRNHGLRNYDKEEIEKVKKLRNEWMDLEAYSVINKEKEEEWKNEITVELNNLGINEWDENRSIIEESSKWIKEESSIMNENKIMEQSENKQKIMKRNKKFRASFFINEVGMKEFYKKFHHPSYISKGIRKIVPDNPKIIRIVRPTIKILDNRELTEVLNFAYPNRMQELIYTDINRIKKGDNTEYPWISKNRSISYLPSYDLTIEGAKHRELVLIKLILLETISLKKVYPSSDLISELIKVQTTKINLEKKALGIEINNELSETDEVIIEKVKENKKKGWFYRLFKSENGKEELLKKKKEDSDIWTDSKNIKLWHEIVEPKPELPKRQNRSLKLDEKIWRSIAPAEREKIKSNIAVNKAKWEAEQKKWKAAMKKWEEQTEKYWAQFSDWPQGPDGYHYDQHISVSYFTEKGEDDPSHYPWPLMFKGNEKLRPIEPIFLDYDSDNINPPPLLLTSEKDLMKLYCGSTRRWTPTEWRRREEIYSHYDAIRIHRAKEVENWLIHLKNWAEKHKSSLDFVSHDDYIYKIVMANHDSFPWLNKKYKLDIQKLEKELDKSKEEVSNNIYIKNKVENSKNLPTLPEVNKLESVLKEKKSLPIFNKYLPIEEVLPDLNKRFPIVFNSLTEEQKNRALALLLAKQNRECSIILENLKIGDVKEVNNKKQDGTILLDKELVRDFLDDPITQRELFWKAFYESDPANIEEQERLVNLILDPDSRNWDFNVKGYEGKRYVPKLVRYDDGTVRLGWPEQIPIAVDSYARPEIIRTKVKEKIKREIIDKNKDIIMEVEKEDKNYKDINWMKKEKGEEIKVKSSLGIIELSENIMKEEKRINKEMRKIESESKTKKYNVDTKGNESLGVVVTDEIKLIKKKSEIKEMEVDNKGKSIKKKIKSFFNKMKVAISKERLDNVKIDNIKDKEILPELSRIDRIEEINKSGKIQEISKNNESQEISKMSENQEMDKKSITEVVGNEDIIQEMDINNKIQERDKERLSLLEEDGYTDQERKKYLEIENRLNWKYTSEDEKRDRWIWLYENGRDYKKGRLTDYDLFMYIANKREKVREKLIIEWEEEQKIKKIAKEKAIKKGIELADLKKQLDTWEWAINEEEKQKKLAEEGWDLWCSNMRIAELQKELDASEAKKRAKVEKKRIEYEWAKSVREEEAEKTWADNEWKRAREILKKDFLNHVERVEGMKVERAKVKLSKRLALLNEQKVEREIRWAQANPPQQDYKGWGLSKEEVEAMSAEDLEMYLRPWIDVHKAEWERTIEILDVLMEKRTPYNKRKDIWTPIEIKEKKWQMSYNKSAYRLEQNYYLGEWFPKLPNPETVSSNDDYIETVSIDTKEESSNSASDSASDPDAESDAFLGNKTNMESNKNTTTKNQLKLKSNLDSDFKIKTGKESTPSLVNSSLITEKGSIPELNPDKEEWRIIHSTNPLNPKTYMLGPDGKKRLVKYPWDIQWEEIDVAEAIKEKIHARVIEQGKEEIKAQKELDNKKSPLLEKLIKTEKHRQELLNKGIDPYDPNAIFVNKEAAHAITIPIIDRAIGGIDYRLDRLRWESDWRFSANNIRMTLAEAWEHYHNAGPSEEKLGVDYYDTQKILMKLFVEIDNNERCKRSLEKLKEELITEQVKSQYGKKYTSVDLADMDDERMDWLQSIIDKEKIQKRTVNHINDFIKRLKEGKLDLSELPNPDAIDILEKYIMVQKKGEFNLKCFDSKNPDMKTLKFLELILEPIRYGTYETARWNPEFGPKPWDWWDWPVPQKNPLDKYKLKEKYN